MNKVNTTAIIIPASAKMSDLNNILGRPNKLLVDFPQALCSIYLLIRSWPDSLLIPKTKFKVYFNGPVMFYILNILPSTHSKPFFKLKF